MNAKRKSEEKLIFEGVQKIKMGVDQKKHKKSIKTHWIFLTCGIILFDPLGIFCNYGAEDGRSATARVRLADPETEKKLADLESEVKRLKLETDRLKTENIQKQTENAQKKEELKKLESEFRQVKSGLEAEVKSLNGVNSELRKELLETLEKYSIQSEQLKRLELSAASLMETLNPVYAGQRDIELAEALLLLQNAGTELVGRSNYLCDLLRDRLVKLEIDEVEKAKIKLALDELDNAGGVFAKMSAPPEKAAGIESCRILELNDKLGAIVLSAGYRNGVRTNMSLRTGKDNEFVLRVVAIRPFVSVAVLESGSMSRLSPGMTVRAAGTK